MRITSLYLLRLVCSQELDYLVGAVANPKKPFAAIVGGSKVSTKIGVIESLLEKVDILLLGGGMIFTFYKAQGHSVGSSLVEEDKLNLAVSLMEKAKAKGVSLMLPTDVVAADKFAADANSKVRSSLFLCFFFELLFIRSSCNQLLELLHFLIVFAVQMLSRETTFGQFS